MEYFDLVFYHLPLFYQGTKTQLKYFHQQQNVILAENNFFGSKTLGIMAFSTMTLAYKTNLAKLKALGIIICRIMESRQ
jgi:hypothetical protein